MISDTSFTLGTPSYDYRTNQWDIWHTPDDKSFDNLAHTPLMYWYIIDI